MKTTNVWASRDVDSNVIKIWVNEPEFVLPNKVWVGKTKDYLGLSCVEKYPGPYLEGGEHQHVAIMIMEIV